MKVGEWVSGVHRNKKFNGYIHEIREKDLVIILPLTKGNKVIVKYPDEIVSIEEATLGMDELNSLLDLALKTKDEEWFNEIIYEMSLWKSVDEIESL